MKRNHFPSPLILVLALIVSCSKSSQRTESVQATQSIAAEQELLLHAYDKSFLKLLPETVNVEVLDEDNHMYLLSSSEFKNQESVWIERLQTWPSVDFVEPNFMYSVAKLPRDPYWMDLWGLENYGQDAPNGIEGEPKADIGATQAWEVTQGNRDADSPIVAVIDTGIDYSHPDLRDNMWINRPEADGIQGQDDDKNGFVDDIYGYDFVSSGRAAPHYNQIGDPDPMDENDHGTHCAGTIAGVGNNGIGVTGINWKGRLMALRFLDANGVGRASDSLRAIYYAIKMKVDVISASYGGGPAEKSTQLAISKAGQAGILFVAAAGNDSQNNDFTPAYPASYPLPNILSIAATDNRDRIASFSNYGDQSVHLAAPGVSIRSTVSTFHHKGDAIYGVLSGTSMAAPHVSGAAALVLSARPELRGHPVELAQRLVNTADWRPQLSGRVRTGGRLNVNNAVREIQTNRSPLTSVNWIEEQVQLSTPRLNTEQTEALFEIQRPGSLAMQLHVKTSRVDAPFDVIGLFDGMYRMVAQLPEMSDDFWLPPVFGDKIIVQFSNSVVRLNKANIVEIPINDPNPEGGGCIIEGKVKKCSTFEIGQPFVNFFSEGAEFDRIRYVKVLK